MRREQIIEASLRRFALDGFHATTMADVIRESGLSAGAVYRYFPSKNHLVAACAASVFSAVRGQLAVRLDGPEPISPSEALRLMLGTALRHATAPDGMDYSRVAVTVWAEALRDDALMAMLRDLYAVLRGDLVTVLRRWRDAGHLAADADVEHAGQALFSLVPGFLLQRLIFGDVDVDRYTAGLETLTSAGRA